MKLQDTNELKQEALTILIEECAEVIQSITKVKRFGAQTINSETGVTNSDALTQELADLFAVLELAAKHQAIKRPSSEMIDRSITRKQEYSSL